VEAIIALLWRLGDADARRRPQSHVGNQDGTSILTLATMIIRGFRRSRWRGSRIAVDHCAFPIGWHGYWPQRVFNKRIEIKTIVLVSLAVGQAAQSNRTLFFLGWLTILSRYSYAPPKAEGSNMPEHLEHLKPRADWLTEKQPYFHVNCASSLQTDSNARFNATNRFEIARRRKKGISRSMR
jgi:hypothetical protein